MYSGSRSCAVVAFGPKTRPPWNVSAPARSLYASKLSVVAADGTAPETSIMETEPYGSVVVGSLPSVKQYDFGSPSLADTT